MYIWGVYWSYQNKGETEMTIHSKKIHRINYRDTTTSRDVSSCGIDIKDNGTADNHEVTCKRCLNAWW